MHCWSEPKLAVLRRPITPVDLYKLGLACAIFSIVPLLMADNPLFASSLLYLGGSMLVVGFCWEAFNFVRASTRHSTMSAIFFAVPSGALIGSISLAYSKILVNEATRMNPEDFQNSVNIIAAVITPVILAYLIALVLSVYGFVYILAGTIRNLLVKSFRRAARENSDVVVAARSTAAILLSISISTIDISARHPGSLAHEFVGIVIAFADHYEFVPCQDLPAPARYKLIESDTVSVAGFSGSFHFTVRRCEEVK